MNPQPLKMTRAIRRQVYAIDIVFATSLNMAATTGTIPTKTKRVLARIQNRVENLRLMVQGGPRFVLSPRDRKKYLKNLCVIKGVISKSIDFGRIESDFINAVLLIVEDTREASKKSKNKRLKLEWDLLNRSLFTLYNHMIETHPEPEPGEPGPGSRDDNWAGYKYERLGAAMGNRLADVVMQ